MIFTLQFNYITQLLPSDNTKLPSDVQIILTFLFHKESFKLPYQIKVKERFNCKIQKMMFSFMVYGKNIYFGQWNKNCNHYSVERSTQENNTSFNKEMLCKCAAK